MDLIHLQNPKLIRIPTLGIVLKISSVAAFTAALAVRRNLDAELSLLSAVNLIDPASINHPQTPQDWFILFQQQPVIALIQSNFFDLINYLLVAIIFFTLVAIHYSLNPNAAKTAFALTLIGVVAYLITNQSLTLFSLAHQYATADIETQFRLFSAGERFIRFSEINSFQGTGLYISYFSVLLAGLILSLVMRKGALFSRQTVYAGIIANGVGLLYYVFLIWLPAYVFLPVSISALFLVAWYLMIGRRLWILSNVNKISLHQGDNLNTLTPFRVSNLD